MSDKWTEEELEREKSGKTGFAVSQKYDCPHVEKYLNTKLDKVNEICKIFNEY